MIRTILSHDIDAGTARIRFEHQGVTLEDTYQLIQIIPGTSYVLAAMNLPFTEEAQLAAMNYLEASVTRGIEAGMIVNKPEAYVPPTPEPEEPSDEPELPLEPEAE